MSVSEVSFKNEKYVVARGFLSKEICKIAEQYCLFEMLNDFRPDTGEFSQVPGTHSVHADSLMESLLLFVQPKIEKITNLKLIPTYSYYRVYKPGDILKDHTDRPSCEISATVTLGFKYNKKHDKYRWSLHAYVDDEKRYLECEPGDAVIYKGCEITHGRDLFDVDKYSYQAQVFLHYVDVDGPYAETWKYDQRPSIGIKK